MSQPPILLLDGALGTELQGRGKDVSNPLWSASLLMNDPDAIYQVHKDYLEAGADIIVTSSYQASIDGFLRSGLSEQEATELIRKSVKLAIAARDDFLETDQARHKRKPLVAASVGPYGAFLANGAEYTGDYGEPNGHDYLASFHGPRLKAILDAKPDMLAIETIPRVEEALAIIKLIQSLNPTIPFYLSFSVQRPDSRVFADLVKLRKFGFQFPSSMLAIGVNCCPLDHATAIVSTMHEIFPDTPLVVYPNSGEQYDPTTKEWVPNFKRCEMSELWKTWASLGATVVGGCCRTGPADIIRLRISIDNYLRGRPCGS